MDNTTHRLMMGAGSSDPIGQQEFYAAGTANETRHSFVVPPNVRTLHAVLIGAGRAGDAGDTGAQKGGSGGSGGDLRWINNLPVIPGETLTIQIGSAFGYAPTRIEAVRGGVTVNLLTCAAFGASSAFGPGPYGGTIGGGNGGMGGGAANTVGNTSGGGGGGAGGYSGGGGRGADGQNGGTSASSGTGGGGGGGNRNQRGGGVGLFGEGASGAANGGNGSGIGGYGAGGPGSVGSNFVGSSGAARLIWGPFRSFPSTKTTDQFA